MEEATEVLGGVVGVIFGFLWYGSGIWGIIILAQKGYLAFIGGAGFFVLLFFGWWALLIAGAVLVGLGPITLAIAKVMRQRQKCPYCKKWVGGDVSRCPNCTSAMEPLY